jgi:TRAP-type transport system small permease protein
VSTGVSPAIESKQAQPPAAAEPGVFRSVHRWLVRASFALGAAGLLLAMAIDALAVSGRLLGRPLLGSIELSQCCVVLFASAALVGTTLQRGHASVHLLTERLPARARRWFQRSSQLLSALFFVALALGSLIVLGDLWRGGETTELLGLPLKPLRLVWCTSALLIVVLFVSESFSHGSSEGGAQPELPGSPR